MLHMSPNYFTTKKILRKLHRDFLCKNIPSILVNMKGERSSEFYETLFELEGVRNEEKGAFWEQNISLALLYNIEAISETSLSCSAEILRF